MNCANHPDVPGTLGIDLPSIGVRKFLCEPCKASIAATLSQFKGKRESWDHAGYDYAVMGDNYGVRTTSGWRTVYAPDQGEWK